MLRCSVLGCLKLQFFLLGNTFLPQTKHWSQAPMYLLLYYQHREIMFCLPLLNKIGYFISMIETNYEARVEYILYSQIIKSLDRLTL